jgi:hypothetical protein
MTLQIPFTPRALAASDLDDAAWSRAAVAPLERYWSGADAPPERRAEGRLLWTPDALMVRFACAQGEPFVVHEKPDLSCKTMQLWDRDVCEIFVAPDTPERYFEFEAAPTGEWLDVEINWENGARTPCWEYASGMRTSARREENGWTAAMRLPWAAFGRKPQAGERWRGNLFRCVGPLGAERGYLAWRPTQTPQPNFHVPQAFGWLEFSGEKRL